MDKQLQDKCKRIILLHKGYKSEYWKVKRRNELYELMMPFLLKWIRSILRKWGRFMEECELISVSWDAFCFCFDRCRNPDIPVPKHFYEYTRYFLLMKFAKEDKVSIHLDELEEIINTIPCEDDGSLTCLITLFQFREIIPDKYKIVWDDAAQSLSSAPRFRCKSKNVGMSDYTYNRIKEVFVPIIKFIMKV